MLSNKLYLLAITLVFASESVLTGERIYTNYCYDGQDPIFWTRKEKLQAFAKGPCSPAILIPGIAGSVLQVTIDCKVLKKTNPAIFRSCGWNGCGFFDRSPNREYRAWIPSPGTPMSVVLLGRTCFSNLVGPKYTTENGKLKYVPTEGVTIKPYGATKYTRKFSRGLCSVKGLQDLVKVPIIQNLLPELVRYFKELSSQLIDMGYEPGLTLQALPYDFRLSQGMDDLTQAYPKILRDLHKITNKKITIFAHSLGNLRTAQTLWGITQEEKDTLIANMISLYPPFLGSSNLISILTCGVTSYQLKIGPITFGIHFKAYWRTVASFVSIFQLIPSDAYISQANQPWMQTIKKRIDYEAGRSDDPVISWLPSRDQNCYTGFDNQKCRSGLYNYTDLGTSVTGEKITTANLEDWLANNSIVNNFREKWATRDPRFNELANTGVPTALLLTNVVKSEQKFTFHVNPKSWVQNKKKFCTDKGGQYGISYFPGDGTVPATSMSTQMIKQALDYDNQVPGAKPVTFVDVCSTYNEKSDPFDVYKPHQEKLMTKNKWIGMPCDCTQNKNRHCDHTAIFFLQAMIDFTKNTLDTRETTELTPYITDKDDAFLEDYVDNCRLFADNMNGVFKDDGYNLFWRDSDTAEEKREKVDKVRMF